MPRRRTQLSRQTATAKRLRVLRSNETEDENMHRLATQRAITEQNRARESSVERSQRLASQNFRTLANRQRESSADRSQRLASQNARTLANRDRESSAERSQRLASQNSRTLANRDRESSAERSQRLTQQNARSTRNRTRRQHNLLNDAFAYDCKYKCHYCDKNNIISVNGVYHRSQLLNISIENVNLHMEIDTGAAISLIPYSCYTRYFSKFDLQQTNVQLKVAGIRSAATVAYGGRTLLRCCLKSTSDSRPVSCLLSTFDACDLWCIPLSGASCSGVYSRGVAVDFRGNRDRDLPISQPASWS
ncbi:hypothetical protein ACJJTC_012426 [Scirpophaga incertulas]